MVPQVSEALHPDSLPTTSDLQLKCPLRHRPLTDSAPPLSSSVSLCSGCSICHHCNLLGMSQTWCFLPLKGSGQMFTSLESACRPESTGLGWVCLNARLKEEPKCAPSEWVTSHFTGTSRLGEIIFVELLLSQRSPSNPSLCKFRPLDMWLTT